MSIHLQDRLHLIQVIDGIYLLDLWEFLEAYRQLIGLISPLEGKGVLAWEVGLSCDRGDIALYRHREAIDFALLGECP